MVLASFGVCHGQSEERLEYRDTDTKKNGHGQNGDGKDSN